MTADRVLAADAGRACDPRRGRADDLDRGAAADPGGQVRPELVTRIVCGGSAAPRGLIEAYDKLGLEHRPRLGHDRDVAARHASRSHASELDAADATTQLDFRACQGMPVPGVELRVLDGDGHEVAWDGQTMGELVVRGPWVTATYYNDDRSAGSFTADGWFRTGDVAMMHPNGYIEIADRTKDVIKSGGEWISSVALENALMAHPKVQEAAVIGVPDERWSERPLACVVPRPDSRTRSLRTSSRRIWRRSSRSGGCPNATCSWTSCPRPASASSTRRRCAQQHAHSEVAIRVAVAPA